tara:strand:- start:940 stop:1371 length:432 start_codon:yes stop_codon:yes gene_type:complete
MSTARWFMAHNRSVDEGLVDLWTKELREALTTPEFEAEVTSGRDDYIVRAAALGGWNSWCRDVPRGCRYDGEPIFHGVIVPIDSRLKTHTVGRATAQIIDGFIEENKHAYTWCPASGAFNNIIGTASTDCDDWKGWATLTISG